MAEQKRQVNHRFCERCDKQLTWFTYHTVWHDGAYHLYCTQCWLNRIWEGKYEEGSKK